MSHSAPCASVIRVGLSAWSCRYGAPFMCTISPSVYHSVLVFHLHRGLEADPIYLRDVDLKNWISMDKPTLATYHDEDGKVSSCGIFVPLKGLEMPSFEERQRIVSQDPLACVDGFRTLVQLVLRTMFGVRACSDCPARSKRCSCQDLFGSVSNVEGGVFGMIEAYAGSIEAQLAGWLHAHILVWLKWVYQHCSMHELARMLITRTGAFARGMADMDKWSARCCSESFANPEVFNEIQLDNIENAWTTRHRDDAALMVHGYSDRVASMDADAFRAWHDKSSDIRSATSMLHVHPKDQHGNRRVPRSCLQKSEKAKRKRQAAIRKGKPLEECRACKYSFPKGELRKACVLCKRLARKLYRGAPGYRAKVGQHEGPRYGYNTTSGYCHKAVPLGETHPAISVVAGCNFHVRRTDKTPPVGAAHSDECKSKACQRRSHETINKLTRTIGKIARQNVKYVNSYTAKAQPIAKDRVKNFGKIHDYRLRQFKLRTPIGKEQRPLTLSKFAQRCAARLLTDTITKAKTMYGPEVLNLMLYSRENDSTAAESFFSASQVALPCPQLRLELSTARETRNYAFAKQRVKIQGDGDNARLAPDVANFSAYLYGLRASHDAIWLAPPHQFWQHWYFQLATFPRSIAEDADRGKYPKHCVLTEEGKYFYESHGHKCDVDFEPGVHYVLAKSSGCINGQHWIALHDDAPDEYKHKFVIVRHVTPKVPYFLYPFDSKPSKEARALAVMAFFSPWTSIASAATDAVPFAQTIKTQTCSYVEAWQRYITDGVPCTAVKNSIRGFLMMHTVGEVNAADSDNEENCEDTTRLSGMSMTELKETKLNGHNINVDLWEAGRAHRTAASVGTSTPAGDTRNSLAFMSSAEPKPTPELREGNPSTTGEKTWYTFYDTQNVPQIVDDWLQTRANSQTRRIEEQEQFIGDFTTYLKHRSGEVKAILSKTEDIAVMPPPMYFVTGMPGTGKSFVSQELRSLFDALGMEENLDYVFTAYMAATALQSNGQTMHHLMGANMYGDGDAANVDGQRLQIIIVDEISMVDAKLFSTFGVKIKFRCGKSPWGAYKFGGCIVICCGDFVQLPPTGGTTLDTPPDATYHHLTPDHVIRSGLELFWNNPELKLFELCEQVRCDDEWWVSVWIAMRFGRLSSVDVDFLHGLDTPVPGSFLDGAVLCNSEECLALVDQCATEIRCRECSICSRHRDDRHVIRPFSPDDERWQRALAEAARLLCAKNIDVYAHGLARAREEAMELKQPFLISCAHDVILWDPGMNTDRKLQLKRAWLDVDASKANELAGKVPIAVGLTVALSMHMKNGDRDKYGLTKNRLGKIVGWKSNEQEPPHTPETTHFAYVPDVVYVQFFEKDGTPAKWKHPEVPGTSGVYPVKKVKVTWHVAKNEDQPVSRFQIPLVPGLSSTIHVAQGTEMFPIIKLDETITPTHVFVAMTRSRRSSRCLIEPSDNFDFGVFGKGTPLNPKNELLLAHLRGDEDFEEQLVEYHSRANAKKPKADPKSISSSRTLAGQSGDRKRKREGGENGDHQRKGGDRVQQQAAGREGGRAGDVEDKRKAGRAGDFEDTRGAGQTSGLARGAAARRRRGQDDDATIAATANISRFSSVRDRVEKANGMTVIQAIELNIYTLRTLRSDESAEYIALVRTSDRIPDPSVRDTDGDDLRSAEIHMDGDDDYFMSHPTDDFSD